MHKRNNKIAISRQQGFTLIELMVVVAIVAIIASIAIPSYQRYVVRANRTAVESYMMQIANKQEQYRLDARTYATTLAALQLNTPPNEVQGKYNVSLGNATATAYSITATPTTAQNDTTCGVVALDQSGTKGALCATVGGNVTYTGATMNCTAPVKSCW